MPSSAIPTPPTSPLFPYTTLFRSSSSLHPDHELSLAKLKAVHGAKKSAGSLAINSFNSSILARPSSAIARARASGSSARSWSRVWIDRKSTRLNSSHANISYAVFCYTYAPHLSTLSLHDALPIFVVAPPGPRTVPRQAESRSWCEEVGWLFGHQLLQFLHLG